MEAAPTLGEIREEIAKAETAGSNPIPKGMSKQDYAELKFGEALSEQDDYDLLVMGHTQGKGGYCFVNGLLTTQIARYAKNYKYIVVDNEAGMEHISRGILPSVDTIILVSDCSRRGVQGGRTYREADSGMWTEAQVRRTDYQSRSGWSAECGNERRDRKTGPSSAGRRSSGRAGV